MFATTNNRLKAIGPIVSSLQYMQEQYSEIYKWKKQDAENSFFILFPALTRFEDHLKCRLSSQHSELIYTVYIQKEELSIFINLFKQYKVPFFVNYNKNGFIIEISFNDIIDNVIEIEQKKIGQQIKELKANTTSNDFYWGQNK